MAEQEKQSRRGRWSVKSLVAIVLCTLILSSAAVGYAVENDLIELPWTTVFSVDDEGAITDEDGNVAGQMTENEDGTLTTTWTGETHGSKSWSTDEPQKVKDVQSIIKFSPRKR